MQLFNGLFCNVVILQPVNFGDFNSCIVIKKIAINQNIPLGTHEQILFVSVIEETYINISLLFGPRKLDFSKII